MYRKALYASSTTKRSKLPIYQKAKSGLLRKRKTLSLTMFDHLYVRNIAKNGKGFLKL